MNCVPFFGILVKLSLLWCGDGVCRVFPRTCLSPSRHGKDIPLLLPSFTSGMIADVCVRFVCPSFGGKAKRVTIIAGDGGGGDTKTEPPNAQNIDQHWVFLIGIRRQPG